jgi:hypothetical protein
MNLAILLLSCALLTSGTQEASPEQAQPQATQAPDAAQSPAPPSQASPENQTTPEKCQKPGGSTASTSSDDTTVTASPGAKKPKTGKAAGKKHGPRKVVVREGGTGETQMQLSAGIPAEQASHQRQSTDQLLNSTEVNLRRISNRPLLDEQKAMVTQIHRYIEEAQAAIKAGDVTRGRNLALKAHLLSDELLPH